MHSRLSMIIAIMGVLATAVACSDESPEGPLANTPDKSAVMACEKLIKPTSNREFVVADAMAISAAELEAQLVDPGDWEIFQSASGPLLRCEFEREGHTGTMNLALAQDTRSTAWLRPLPKWVESSESPRPTG